MLELAVLHVLYERQVELGHVVLVHVEKDVAYHDDALLDLLPHSVELTQELLIMRQLDVLGYWLQKLHRGVFDAVVEHLTVLVEDEVVGSAVKLLIGERTRLLVVNLVDGVLDRLPVLLGLGTLHVGVAHLVPINQKLVCR